MIQGPTEENSMKELTDTIKLLYEFDKDEWMVNDIVGLVDELTGLFAHLNPRYHQVFMYRLQLGPAVLLLSEMIT